MKIPKSIWNLPPGTTLQALGSTGTYWHYGIYDGQGRVIHNKKHYQVVREPLEKFSEGQKIHVNQHITSDNLYVAYQRAEDRIGERFTLSGNNCEHFVREVHGMPKESKQLQAHVAVGVIALLFAFFGAKK